VRVPRAVSLGLMAATVLAGCGSPVGPPVSSGASSRATGLPSTNTSGATGLPPANTSGSTGLPPAEGTGDESPDTGGAGAVSVSLPSLPIGGAESVNSDDGDRCVSAAYLGDQEEQRIPVGVRIRVTSVRFSSDLLIVGGNGCSSDGRACLGEDAFTDEQRNCRLPVQVTREPRPPAGQPPDPDGVQETVTVGMDAAVDCPPDLHQQCTAFAHSLDGVPAQTVSVTVNGSSSENSSENSSGGSSGASSGRSSESSGSPGSSVDTTTRPSSDTGSPG
jgi:hypothetical protein